MLDQCNAVCRVTQPTKVNKYPSEDHRLRAVRGSGSTVVTMTSKVNGKTETLTPCRSVTPENIEIKIGVNDYVIEPTTLPIFVTIIITSKKVKLSLVHL